MLLHSFQLCGKCDAAFLHAGADGAVVGFCDALGDGEADAEAAGLGAAGGVCAVKAVKEPAERGRVERIALIFRADDDAAPPLSPRKRRWAYRALRT